jgi:hypothetical protein
LELVLTEQQRILRESAERLVAGSVAGAQGGRQACAAAHRSRALGEDRAGRLALDPGA